MRLHENSKLFNSAIEATAQQMSLREVYIEKDYWITLALHTIFNSNNNIIAIFKGGTSLSKCFNFISRFSEDIDIVVASEPADCLY